jgi:hypothetical protein
LLLPPDAQGVCWTEDRECALDFAERHGVLARRRAVDDLWATEVEPAALWARMPLAYTATGRVLADEWVVDPDQLGPVRRWTSDELDSTAEALPIGWTA